MAVSLQVIYPVSDESRFDYDYYVGTHIPIVERDMGPHIDQVVVTKGVAGGADVPPAFHAVATMTFADQAALDAALGNAGAALEDIPNFTNVQPQMLIGEVLA